TQMATNEATTTVMRAGASTVKNMLTDMVVSSFVSGVSTVAKGAIIGGFHGMLGTMGISPIVRLSSTPSTFLRPEQIEAAAKASEAGDKLGTLITVGKEFAKSAWKYI